MILKMDYCGRIADEGDIENKVLKVVYIYMKKYHLKYIIYFNTTIIEI